MFAPGDIIYGFAKGLYRPKFKYVVSIFKDADLNILAQFTTSQENQLISQFDNPEVVCHMYDDVYINLVYALYKSDFSPAEYKPILEKILTEFYKPKFRKSFFFC